MTGTILIVSAAVIVRACGAAARIDGHSLFCTAGWILCAIAGWLLASAAGSLAPLWSALAVGCGGALLNFLAFQQNRQLLWILADATVVAVAGMLSIPRGDLTILIVAALISALLGLMLDLLLQRVTKRMRLGMLFAFFTASVSIAATKGSKIFAVASYSPGIFLHLGVVPVHKGERIVLETGAVAWLDRPARDGPHPAALLFHGANSEGSKQSSAIVLRRALSEAGFIVLAVDHPGYGASPVPSVDADIDAWDPLPTVLAALNALRGLPNIDGIIAVGHSLGVPDTLRLLQTKQDLRAAIVFGAALGDSTDVNDYWYERFHTDRKMDKWLSRDRVRQIQQRFYEDGRLLQDIDPQHPPIIFVRFGLEWSNIAATRDAWYESISGRKLLWDLVNSTHYFNSKKFIDLVVCDTRVTRGLASELRHLASSSPEKVDGFTRASR